MNVQLSQCPFYYFRKTYNYVSKMAASDDSEALLRVHSKDLHEHIAQEVGECLESGLYTDLMIRCNNGQTLHGHKLVLSAVSPYLKWVSSDILKQPYN